MASLQRTPAEQRLLTRYPDIIVKNTGQDKFNAYYTVLVPSKYTVTRRPGEVGDFSIEDMEQAVGWDNNYWGAAVQGQSAAEGGTLYSFKCYKD
jgi:hypothetical protein